MNTFIFERYEFDTANNTASFYYSFDHERQFVERVRFPESTLAYNATVLDRVMFLAFMLIGTSYYKTFPTRSVEIRTGEIDSWQANFFTTVYQEGLSQFAFENHHQRDDLAYFLATTPSAPSPVSYDGKGIIALQSGGKDSLLVAALLAEKNISFSSLYISSTDSHPAVLDEISSDMAVAVRMIDRPALARAAQEGGSNGHVPVTYIVLSYALIQATLTGAQTILASIGHEGEEPHAFIGDLPVNHQWSKTWQAEQLFAEYVTKYISADIQVGSPIRNLSELRVTELFSTHAWEKFGSAFSSCNRANYQQGADNTALKWCGECPKCANSYLLFAPFIDSTVLQGLFGNQDLFLKSELTDTFKGLLGIDGVMKPFECVGEIDELRYAYYRTRQKGGYATLPFAVPESSFSSDVQYPAQIWATEIIQHRSQA